MRAVRCSACAAAAGRVGRAGGGERWRHQPRRRATRRLLPIRPAERWAAGAWAAWVVGRAWEVNFAAARGPGAGGQSPIHSVPGRIMRGPGRPRPLGLLTGPHLPTRPPACRRAPCSVCANLEGRRSAGGGGGGHGSPGSDAWEGLQAGEAARCWSLRDLLLWMCAEGLATRAKGFLLNGGGATVAPAWWREGGSSPEVAGACAVLLLWWSSCKRPVPEQQVVIGIGPSCGSGAWCTSATAVAVNACAAGMRRICFDSTNAPGL